ncbi:hypothetical protein ABIA32_000651 [Streptacidiphilus sp. MAP12-20]|uniref:DUF2264 domain-containing protein n=1 Tax=Streptacidiphilus sp. MAP12-20 TaxID=3156299 RepID=UPI00351199EE
MRQPAPTLPTIRSPFTGWDRSHWEAHADRLLDGVLPYASPHFAGYALPGPPSWSGPASDALEGFARTFLLAAFRIAGARGRGMEAAQLLERYATGLAAGADPRHPEAWPRIDRDRIQPMVEAASVALALHETRDWLWDALSSTTQEQVTAWLGGFVGRRPVDNNWMLFQTTVEEFLSSVGALHDDAEIRRGLEALEDWYLGHGWYSDGPYGTTGGHITGGLRVDHYNGWALHLYPLLWTRVAADGPRAALADQLGARYRERLRLFLADYVHLIGGDGAPLHQGRSLTYRFAAAAPLWMGELFDCSPGPSGLARRAASGMLRHFAKHGAPDADGILTRGWHAPCPGITQAYSGPASPYWASKGFIGLLLSADHPAWTATEQPLPVDTGDTVRLLAGVNWLVQGTKADGIVRVHNHGSDGLDPHATPHSAPSERLSDPHYAKLAFTTHTGPVLSARQADNELVLTSPDGTLTIPRGRITPLPGLQVGPPLAASAYAVDATVGARVETVTLLDGRFELRLHAVLAPAGWQIRTGGYAVAAATPPVTRRGRHWTLVRHPTDGTLSALAPLHGFEPEAVTVTPAEHANAFGPYAAFPVAAAVQPSTGLCVYATCTTLTGTPLDPDEPSPFSLRVTPDAVVVTHPHRADELRLRLCVALASAVPDVHSPLLTLPAGARTATQGTPVPGSGSDKIS